MTHAPTVATRRVDLQFGGVEVAMLCVADLDPHVDAERLLGLGEVDEPPYWMHLWPGALTLARRLVDGPSLRGRRVLEIGCGLGLPSLVAARCGARTVACDRQFDPLVVLADSAALNDCALATVQMDWRGMALRGRFDVVMGADITYDASQEDALVNVFARHLSAGGRLLLADSVNTHRQGLMGRLAVAGFDCSESKTTEREDGRVVWVRCIEGVKA